MAPRPRRALARGAAHGLRILALVAWPACWLAATWHHIAICGWGLSSWLCTEPPLTALTHQLLVSCSPVASLTLAALADDLWSQG